MGESPQLPAQNQPHADIRTKLNATRDCISITNEIKERLTKNKLADAELAR